MFTHKLLVAAVLLTGVGAAFSFARVKSQVRPLSKSQRNLSTCQLHQTALQTETVPITYGLVEFAPDFLKAQQRQFPNAHSAAFGGCIVENAKWQTVKFCPKCRQAEKAWAKTHQHTVNSSD